MKPICAGEGAALVAEQFVFEQRFRERHTIDDDHGHALARTPLVDGAREEFLAGAAFPEEENAGVRVGGATRGFDDGLDLRAVADDGGIPVLHVRLKGGHLPLQGVPLQRFLNHDQEMVFFERLRQEVVGPVAHGFHGVRDRAGGGHDNDGDVLGLLVLGHALEHVHALETGQVEVQQHQVRGFLLDELDAAQAVGGRQRFIAARVETILQHRDDVLVVVDYENLGLHRYRDPSETISCALFAVILPSHS